MKCCHIFHFITKLSGPHSPPHTIPPDCVFVRKGRPHAASPPLSLIYYDIAVPVSSLVWRFRLPNFDGAGRVAVFLAVVVFRVVVAVLRLVFDFAVAVFLATDRVVFDLAGAAC